MDIETINFNGWPNCLRLANPSLELIVTTDVGPRVVSLRSPSTENVLKSYEEQMGGQGESEWMIRGGHRLWVAPEDETLTYHVDNDPVSYRQEIFSGEVVIESLQTTPRVLRKSLGILVADDSPRVTLRHVITNEGDLDITAAAWALTVMKPGGLEIIPQPPLGEHPRDLLPNRGMVIWPYTDLSDLRWTFGRKYWLLRQAEDYLPFKLGLAHKEQWIAYVLGDSLFIKTFDYDPASPYPDGGCNFETFTNTEMLEIESLGPLVTLSPGESITHFENWYIFPLTEEMHIESEEGLEAFLNAFLAQTHLV